MFNHIEAYSRKEGEQQVSLSFEAPYFKAAAIRHQKDFVTSAKKGKPFVFYAAKLGG